MARLENRRGFAKEILLVLVGGGLGALVGWRIAAPPSGDFPEVARRVSESVVLVWYQDDSGWSNYGTAFAVDGEGHFLTCAHVVPGRLSVTVAVPSPGGEVNHRARVVAVNPDIDAAILQVEDLRLPPLVFGSSREAVVGEEVAITGFPLGYTVNADLTPSLAAGHVAALPEWRAGENGPRIPMIQVDASVALGQSGSPLFRRRTGVVLGMMKSHIRVPGLVESREDVLGAIEAIPEEIVDQAGIGLALPADELRRFLAENGIGS
ncbi:MAG: serine protease [Candidatus Eisenbacteria bacterium]